MTEILKYFDYRHLPETQQEIAQQVHQLAWTMNDTLPQCAETTAGLRKLLEAKDCFVRASLD